MFGACFFLFIVFLEKISYSCPLLVSIIVRVCNSRFYSSNSGPTFFLSSSLPTLFFPFYCPSFLPFYPVFLFLFVSLSCIVLYPATFQISPSECKVGITNTMRPKQSICFSSSPSQPGPSSISPIPKLSTSLHPVA